MRAFVFMMGIVALPVSATVAQTTPDASAEASVPPGVADPATPANPAVTPAPPTMSDQSIAAPTNENASLGKIVMYRGGSMIGMGIACPIRYQGKEVVELARGKYAEWPVAAGHYVLTNKTASVDVIVGPGETRYVRCMIKPGFFVGRSDLQIVDAQSFAEHSAEYEKKEIAVN